MLREPNNKFYLILGIIIVVLVVALTIVSTKLLRLKDDNAPITETTNSLPATWETVIYPPTRFTLNMPRHYTELYQGVADKIGGEVIYSRAFDGNVNYVVSIDEIKFDQKFAGTRTFPAFYHDHLQQYLNESIKNHNNLDRYRFNPKLIFSTTGTWQNAAFLEYTYLTDVREEDDTADANTIVHSKGRLVLDDEVGSDRRNLLYILQMNYKNGHYSEENYQRFINSFSLLPHVNLK
ncbi:MAG: hypothetical protein AAB415_01260 [Patescibacteria group bacterium]